MLTNLQIRKLYARTRCEFGAARNALGCSPNCTDWGRFLTVLKRVLPHPTDDVDAPDIHVIAEEDAAAISRWITLADMGAQNAVLATCPAGEYPIWKNSVLAVENYFARLYDKTV